MSDLYNPATIGGEYSSSQIAKMIRNLMEAQRLAERREEEEKQKRIAAEAERRRREAEEKHAAHVKEVTCMDLPLDWNNIFNDDLRTQGVHTESIPDALILSLTSLGMVDIEYISSITGEDYKTVISVLKGSIYQNPETWGECFYKGWETADEYLSGNLMRKWKAAENANNEYMGYFSDNLKAIENVLPPVVSTDDIYVTLGSPWVPEVIIDDFIRHLLKGRTKYSYFLREDWKTDHDEKTGIWKIQGKSRYDDNFEATSIYGTEKINALHILERTLNMKSVVIKEQVPCRTNPSGKKSIINNEETLAALEKQKLLISEFQKWVWKDKTRKERLQTIFENKYSCVRRRIFDGSFLNFPGMSSEVSLYPYQKDAVARIIFSPNTLLAHEVGSGKTYIMIAAGQELRRLGLSKKNLYVVPNNIVGQWKEIFLQMYPNAKLLIADPKSFSKDKRKTVLKDIRDNDYDGIIMAYSCFEMIPLSKDNAPDVSYTCCCFDKLGITRLFVDEAHNFKNVPIRTKIKDTLGISSTGSKRCRDMMDKVHFVQKTNDGKGVVFATGTPITNSITDIYVMQMYLQSGELGMLDLHNFDSWVGMFAEKKTEFEIDIDTTDYRMTTRFTKFHNIPELTSLLSGIADFHQVRQSEVLPEMDGYSDSLIGKTREFSDFLATISERADMVRNGDVNRKTDNMLKITTDGRKAALDMRLVDAGAAFTYQSKVARCAENVADIYYKTESDKSTQIVFCDISTPKQSFNMYDELKRCLMHLGVPAEQIAFIHDAETERERNALFRKVRKGEIRILIGSTVKLGIGVNIQDRLIAIHHLDVPWRPADMKQREGRIIRQGNMNDKVKVFRYITEGSFDAYSWQLLETKQRFINDLLSGSIEKRSMSDVEDTVLDYAEVKALAIGNPLIKERVEIANELEKVQALQRKYADTRLQLNKELTELPGRIEKKKERISGCEKDIEFYREWKSLNPPVAENSLKKEEAKKRKEFRGRFGRALREHYLETKVLKFESYRGFDIIFPANMSREKPGIWLMRNCKYYVELGDTEVGNLIRVDNFLETLEEYQKKQKKELEMLTDRKESINAELNKDNDYSDRIELLKNKLADIDRQLGVEINE